MTDAWPTRHEGDAGLQPHRTQLAWRRTSLALLGASIASVKVLEPVLGPGAIALGMVGIVLAGALAWGSYRRASQQIAGARLVTACAVVTALLGLGALVFAIGR
ncbi:DUF202 domain-containing protein [Cellulomonas sp. PhB150]|uniref:DUF202 domain-containing protein n=1 Tax=Cellulomonas sp. PhB150 TaxID=2485188 RepID=UPI000F4AAC88|nr:DUF202 domain-containing protein [Cellulomonas sp. PhB150]ROS27765.1 uncharacterized protein DUF202 [Cellulomonas sp. PhB150]